MFGKFKEKLSGWFNSSSEKIEEDIGDNEADEVVDEKDIEKAEKMIEEAKDEIVVDIPTKFDAYNRKTIPDLEKVKEEAETIKKDVIIGEMNIKEAEKEKDEINKFENELDRVDKVIEDAKKEELENVPVKFNVGMQKYEPDLEDLGKGEVNTDNLSEEMAGRLTNTNKGHKSFFGKIKSGLSYKITEEEFEKIFDDLEMLLLDNNVALDAVDDIKSSLSKSLIGREIKKDDLASFIRNELRSALNDLLIEPDNPLDFIKDSKKPFKILFFGINGTGKTTSIAKIANYLRKAGFSVVLAAGDTFRAASIEQLSEHAEKLGVPVIKQEYGADPAAVGFDAIRYAEKNKIDVVLIDTAGRMHTRSNLLSEMEKIVRVTKPDLRIFVAESIAGNDAIEQARAFAEVIDIDGSILSKADIDEKGGTIISVSHATNKPIFYLGTGQNYEDLELFNKERFVESLGL